MYKFIALLIPFVFSAVSGQSGIIDLRGTVVNQANTAVRNIVIGLVNNGLFDTTDEQGEFELYSSEVSTLPKHDRADPAAQMRIERGKFLVLTTSSYSRIRLDVYTLRGEKISTPLNSTLGPGKHRAAAPFLRDGRGASAVYIADLYADGENIRYKLIRAGSGNFSLSRITRSTPSGRAGLGKKSQNTLSDTLVVYRKDLLEYKSYIIDLDRSITLLLDLVPYEIIEIAAAEEQRYPDQVGEDLDYYPYKLSDYLQQVEPYGEHDYEAWCSEFLSWAYKAAGYPLTGGWELDWYLRGNTQIRSWFQENSRFVTKNDSDWVDFEPSPGDFIRYDNEYGGHTGIVMYQEGTTLYTVEGNVSNRVWLRTLQDWKERDDVDGIGMRSGFVESGIAEVVF